MSTLLVNFLPPGHTQLKGAEIYFGSWSQGFGPWLAGSKWKGKEEKRPSSRASREAEGEQETERKGWGQEPSLPHQPHGRVLPPGPAS